LIKLSSVKSRARKMTVRSRICICEYGRARVEKAHRLMAGIYHRDESIETNNHHEPQVEVDEQQKTYIRDVDVWA